MYGRWASGWRRTPLRPTHCRSRRLAVSNCWRSSRNTLRSRRGEIDEYRPDHRDAGRGCARGRGARGLPDRHCRHASTDLLDAWARHVRRTRDRQADAADRTRPARDQRGARAGCRSARAGCGVSPRWRTAGNACRRWRGHAPGMTGTVAPRTAERRRIHVAGLVQGVGFRPFVHRIAAEHTLAGFVANDGDGVVIEVEGLPGSVALFTQALRAEAPPRAHVESLATSAVAALGEREFRIRPS